MIVGEVLLDDRPVEINVGRRSVTLRVQNTGDRPIQVGSHFHFFEVNQVLHFNRAQALGMHLAIPAGAGIRFEPGDEKEVQLVEYGGARRVIGFNALVDGGLTSSATRRRALKNAKDAGFAGVDEPAQAKFERFGSAEDRANAGGAKAAKK